jgi:salicylate hydroxylase
VLARTLRRNRIADGFNLYAKLRFPRTKRLTIASRKTGQFYHLSGMRRQLRNAILRASSPDRFLNRVAWIYGYDPLAN